MCEILRRTLIWLAHHGKMMGVKKSCIRIDSASDNLNKLFLRLCSLLAMELDIEIVVYCGVVSHTRNNVDRVIAFTFKSRKKIHQRVIDDLDFIWREGVRGAPSSYENLYGRTGSVKTVRVPMTDLFFLEAVPDYKLAFSGDFDPEFAGYRTPEFRWVVADDGRVNHLHHPSKPHYFRFTQENSQAIMHYKTDVRNDFLPVVEGTPPSSGCVIDPRGLVFLKAQASTRRFSSYIFEWAAQKPTDVDAIYRYATKVYGLDADFRGLCPWNIILRDTADFILSPGDPPEPRVNEVGVMLESWERFQLQSHEPFGFDSSRGREDAYPGDQFPLLTMTEHWRQWLRSTVVPLDRSAAVENKFPPQVVSSTSAGLAPCRPGFDFQCTVADDASNGAGVGSENSIRLSDVENPPITGGNYPRATQAQVQGRVLNQQRAHMGQCEKCSSMGSVVPLIRCDGRRNPRKQPCCASTKRDALTVFDKEDIGKNNIFVGGANGTLLRVPCQGGVQGVSMKGHICPDSARPVAQTKYTLSGLSENSTGKVIVSVVARLGNLSFQTLSQSSFWCQDCVDSCHLTHFSERSPLHFTCEVCIEAERQDGFYTPKRVVEVVQVRGGTYFLLEFFGYPLPKENTVKSTKTARQNDGFYTGAEIVDQLRSPNILTEWFRRRYPPRDWTERLGNRIEVYDVDAGDWDISCVQWMTMGI